MKDKKCFKCGVIKPLEEFYTHPRMLDGHLGKCKDCTKSDVSKNRTHNIKYYRDFDRNRANNEERKASRYEYYVKNRDTEKHKEMVRISRAKYRDKYPLKYKARIATGNAIRDGRLSREPCSLCGEELVEAHHPDYERPLYVVWLCRKHHMEEHVRTGSFRLEDD